MFILSQILKKHVGYPYSTVQMSLFCHRLISRDQTFHLYSILHHLKLQ